MGDFIKVSNYNPKANFNMVRFGADTPLTEYELNEVQQIQQNTLKTALVNTIGNGFIKSGNLIDSGTSITLSNSVVHLNGKVFEIDSLTSTLNEGETIYLDVFTKTISKTDSIKNLGNQQTSTTVTNYLQDTRLLGIETARREQVCYNLVKTTGVANHDYLIVCKRENGEFKDLRPLGNLNDYKETVEGSHISTESSTGVIQDLEILGNTVQDVDNLADIKSVGELQEDGTYKMSILSCGKNLFNMNSPIKNLASYTTYECLNNVLTVKATNSTGNGYITFDDLCLKDGVEYTISFEAEGTVVNGEPWVQIVNGDGTHFNRYTISPITFLAKGQTSIRFYSNIGSGVTKTKIYKNIQLEEGTVATPYEPYQENKCDILLPCQLEKVGDVADRLYYDDEEKVWCIEKNIVDEVVTYVQSSSIISVSDTVDGVILTSSRQDVRYDNNVNNIVLEGKLWTNRSIPITTNNVYSNTLNHIVCFEKGTTIEQAKDFLLGKKVKYQLATPQKIVLPLSTQISLNSFFGTTHIYMESGEVEGTIKCKIPKSLGATVQSLNNKTDILCDRIEAIEGLKDSQNMKYETDKGYLICKETKNGVIDDLKLEGKTLVNLAKNTRITRSNTVGDFHMGDFGTCFDFPIDANKEYTFIINVLKNTSGVNLTMNDTGAYANFVFPRINSLVNGLNVLKLKVKENVTITQNSYWGTIGLRNSTTIGDIDVEVTILEGDHTQNPPSYFEGLMSVGQDVDKIEVSSVKGDGNLFDGELELGSINNTSGLNEVSTNCLRSKNYIRVQGGKTITLSNDMNYANYIYEYRKDFTLIKLTSKGTTNTITTDINTCYVRFRSIVSATQNNVNVKYILNYGDSTSYKEYITDKKQILFYNENGELEPIQELHEWDSIEKHSDNKWYYHKRSGKVVLNGSEKITIYRTHNNVISFNINIEDSIANKNTDYFISDTINFNKYCYDLDVEGIAFSPYVNKNIYFNILKSKLSTQDLEGFKQWLQANNVTVVYQLAEEEVYELAPLHLDSYANETLILCNSGAISPRMEFKIHNNIGNVVRVLQDRVNKSEEFIKTFNNESSKAENKPYETENGVIEFVSKDGYTDNIVVEGETLINLGSVGLVDTSNSDNVVRTRLHNKGDAFISNTLVSKGTFTLVNYTDKVICFVGTNTSDAWSLSVTVQPHSTTLLQLDGTQCVCGVDFQPEHGWTKDDLSIYNAKTFAIIPGNHLDKEIPYFKDVMSVGQTNDMKLYNFAYEEQNQVDLSNVTWTKNSYVSVNDFSQQSLEGVNVSDYVKVEPNTAYLVKNGNANIPQYDVNKNPIKLGIPYTLINGSRLAENSDDLIYFTTSPETQYVRFTSVTETEKSFKVFEGVKMDIKQIPTTLRSVNANIKDLIVKQGTKYYKYMKCAERVLTDTTPNLTIGDSTKTNTISFIFDSIMTQGFRSKDPTTNDSVANFLNDRFPMYSTNDLTNSDKEGIALGVGKSILVRINKTRLATLDVVGFRTWLKNNAIHLIYEIETPAFVELSNFNVQLFKGVNNLAFVSKGIAKDISFEVTQSKDNELILLKQQVADLSNLVNTILGCKPVGNNSIHLRGNPLPMNENALTQPRISFADGGNDQAVQLRYNSYDVDYKPFGLNVEKVDDTTSQPHLKAFLSVEGELITRQGRLVLGSTNDITKNEIVSVTSDGASKTIMTTYPHDKNGQAIRIGAGGLTVIGGGESPDKYMNELPDVSTLGDEKLILTADHEIVVRAGAQNTFTDNCKSVFHNTGGLTLGSSNGNVKRTTISSAYPSGGANGDVWFRYE